MRIFWNKLSNTVQMVLIQSIQRNNIKASIIWKIKIAEAVHDANMQMQKHTRSEKAVTR